MPRRKQVDSAAIDALFSRQERLARHHQLTALGLPISTTTYQIRPEGPWQRALPGVVLNHRGTPTRRERLIAALLFCGDDAVLTGLSALALKGVRAAQHERDVHVLVPAGNHRSSHRLRRRPTHPARCGATTSGRTPSRECGPGGRRCLPPTQEERRRAGARRRGGPASDVHCVRAVRRGPRGRSATERAEPSGPGRDGRRRPVGGRDACPGDHGCPGHPGARLERLALERTTASSSRPRMLTGRRWPRPFRSTRCAGTSGPAAYKKTQETPA